MPLRDRRLALRMPSTRSGEAPADRRRRDRPGPGLGTTRSGRQKDTSGTNVHPASVTEPPAGDDTPACAAASPACRPARRPEPDPGRHRGLTIQPSRIAISPRPVGAASGVTTTATCPMRRGARAGESVHDEAHRPHRPQCSIRGEVAVDQRQAPAPRQDLNILRRRLTPRTPSWRISRATWSRPIRDPRRAAFHSLQPRRSPRIQRAHPASPTQLRTQPRTPTDALHMIVISLLRSHPAQPASTSAWRTHDRSDSTPIPSWAATRFTVP